MLAWVQAVEVAFTKTYGLLTSKAAPGAGPELLHGVLLGVLGLVRELAARRAGELAEALAGCARVLLSKLQELASMGLTLGLPSDPLSQVRCACMLYKFLAAESFGWMLRTHTPKCASDVAACATANGQRWDAFAHSSPNARAGLSSTSPLPSLFMSCDDDAHRSGYLRVASPCCASYWTACWQAAQLVGFAASCMPRCCSIYSTAGAVPTLIYSLC